MRMFTKRVQKRLFAAALCLLCSHTASAAPISATPKQAKACFFSGFSAYEVSRYSHSKQLWQACLPVTKGTKWHEKTLWYLALVARIQNQPKQAQYQLQRLLRQYEHSSKKAKYLFWLGNSLQLQHRHKQARTAYSLVQNQWPMSYYGLLAHERLQQLPATLESMEAEHRHKQLLLARVQNTTKRTYPTPWFKTVKSASKRTGVHMNMAYAIMRKESNFVRRARSQADAVGVMQLLHSTAKEVARHSGRKVPSRSDLYTPYHSITLGMQYIRSLKQQFGKPHLVCAAYNAGKGRVSSWVRRFGHLQPELFIERIPYAETREYIRKVLTDQYVYSHVLSSCTTCTQNEQPFFATALPTANNKSTPILNAVGKQLLQYPHEQSELFFTPKSPDRGYFTWHSAGARHPRATRQTAQQPWQQHTPGYQSGLRSDSARSAFGARRVADKIASVARLWAPGDLFGGGFYSTYWRPHRQEQNASSSEPTADRTQLPDLSGASFSGIGFTTNADSLQFSMAFTSRSQ